MDVLDTQHHFFYPQKFTQQEPNHSDRLYDLTIPKYQLQNGVVFYQVQLKDLVSNQDYSGYFRFKELKQIYDQLSNRQYELPAFPKTHFWTKTNNNSQLILQRKQQLESFFSQIVNEPVLRGYQEVKKLVKKCKQSHISFRRQNSIDIKADSTYQNRSLSGRASNSSKAYSLNKFDGKKQSKTKVT